MVQLTKLCQVIVLAVILFVSVTSAGHIFRLHRSVSDAEATTASTTESACHDNMPCGWAVYTPFTRKVDYFMKNTCTCLKDKACVKTDDDLSTSAYVYRCRQLTNPEST